MKMITRMTVVAAALGIATTVSAQVMGSADRATQIQWSQQFAQVGDLSDAFIRQGSLWTDGNFVYQLGTEGKTVTLTNISSLSTEGHPRDKELVRKNSKLMVKGKKDVMTREKIGGWDLLVIRDKNQKTLDTYVRWNDGQSDLSALERDLHIIYDGVYTLYSIDQGEATYPNTLAALGSTLLFGPNLFGDQVDSSDDPGDYRINGNSIFFGGNRIKVVRQPSLNVQKRAGKDVYFIDDREVSKKEFEQILYRRKRRLDDEHSGTAHTFDVGRLEFTVGENDHFCLSQLHIQAGSHFFSKITAAPAGKDFHLMILVMFHFNFSLSL